jgi:hypothetical protein
MLVTPSLILCFGYEILYYILEISGTPFSTVNALVGQVITNSGHRGSHELWLPLWFASCCECIIN